MELRQLRYFVAVAEEANISRAAQKIFLTQSALSRQIKALEEEIGQCLLERQAHSIRLTPAGEALLREARDFFNAPTRRWTVSAPLDTACGCASATRPRLRPACYRSPSKTLRRSIRPRMWSCSISPPKKCSPDWKTRRLMSR